MKTFSNWPNSYYMLQSTLVLEYCWKIYGKNMCLYRKQSLANLVIKASLVSQRPGNPVYFVKNEKSNAKTRALELVWSAEDSTLQKSG